MKTVVSEASLCVCFIKVMNWRSLPIPKEPDFGRLCRVPPRMSKPILRETRKRGPRLIHPSSIEGGRIKILLWDCGTRLRHAHERRRTNHIRCKAIANCGPQAQLHFSVFVFYWYRVSLSIGGTGWKVENQEAKTGDKTKACRFQTSMYKHIQTCLQGRLMFCFGTPFLILGT